MPSVISTIKAIVNRGSVRLYKYNHSERLYTHNDSERLYTQTFFRHLSRYAPYDVLRAGDDPGFTRITLGDYGTVDSTTLQFIKKGNIIDLDLPDDIKDELRAVLREVRESLGTTEIWAFSGNRDVSTDKSIQLDTKGRLPDETYGKYTIKGGWSFDRGRPLVSLILISPKTVTLAYPGQLAEILVRMQDENVYDIGKDCFVTSLINCASYAQFHSTGQEGEAYFCFKDEEVTPHADVGWTVFPDQDDGKGRWRHGHGEQYTPLVELRVLKGMSKRGNPAQPI